MPKLSIILIFRYVKNIRCQGSVNKVPVILAERDFLALSSFRQSRGSSLPLPPQFAYQRALGLSESNTPRIGSLSKHIVICEGYSGIRIRTGDLNIRNVASGGALYIVWLYTA